MGAWMVFWGLLLAGTLLFYAGLVVYVAIGGFKDIQQMFKTLDEEHESEEARAERDGE